MESTQESKRQALAQTLTWLSVVAFGLMCLAPFAWENVQRWSYDLLYTLQLLKPINPKTDVVLVYLDETSADKLKQPVEGRWDRRVHARLLDRLTTEGAKAAVFVILFAKESDPAADASFAASINRFRNVILAAETQKMVVKNPTVNARMAVFPLESFAKAAREIGIAGLNPDQDYVIRKHTTHVMGDQIPLLSEITPKLTGADVSKGSVFSNAWLRYYGPPFSLPHVSYADALSSNSLPSGFFKDKIVFIGDGGRRLANGSRYDVFPTPFSIFTVGDSRWMPATEIEATLFLNKVEGTGLTQLGKSSSAVLFTLTGLVLGALATRLKGGSVLVATLVFAVATIGCLFLTMNLWHTWFAWFVVLGQAAIAVVAGKIHSAMVSRE